MQKIIIDEEFKYLLPELDQETYRLLEENILEHGCRDPLILWNGILIDGYNRYNICTTHDIPFKILEKEFDSREEVIIWIISNQVSRRNLTPMQLGHFRGLHYKAEKKIKTTNQYTAKRPQNGTQHSSETQIGKTSVRLAEHYGVSKNTINRDAKLAEAIDSIGVISPEAKTKILSGEIAVSRTKLEALNLASKEEIKTVATQIEEGTYVRRAPRNYDCLASDSLLPEIKQLNTIISSFASNFNSMFKKMNIDGTADLKPVLRSYIDQLEDLYRNIQ